MDTGGGGCIVLDSGVGDVLISSCFDRSVILPRASRAFSSDDPLILKRRKKSQSKGYVSNQAGSEPVSRNILSGTSITSNKTVRVKNQNLAGVHIIDLDQNDNFQSSDLEQDCDFIKWPEISKISQLDASNKGKKHLAKKRPEKSSVGPNLFQQTLLLQESTLYVTVILQQRDSDGDNRLFIALILKRPNIVKSFIDLIPRYDLFDCWNKLRQTALHIAALTPDAKLTRRLLVAGSIVDRRDWAGNTPLHIACRMGSISVAEALLKPVTYLETKQNSYAIPYQKIPQNLEIRNADGLTCLMLAADRRDMKLMDLLFSKDAEVNAIDMKSGKTCLHMFAENGDSDMVRYILQIDGCNINATTYAGFTALEFAHYRGHQVVVNQLLKAGAEYRVRPEKSPDFLAQSDTDENDSDSDSCCIVDG